MSILFTVTVIATFIALAQKEPMVWVSYVPLFPLAVLFFTGLNRFARPYIAKAQGRGGGFCIGGVEGFEDVSKDILNGTRRSRRSKDPSTFEASKSRSESSFD